MKYGDTNRNAKLVRLIKIATDALRTITSSNYNGRSSYITAHDALRKIDNENN